DLLLDLATMCDRPLIDTARRPDGSYAQIPPREFVLLRQFPPAYHIAREIDGLVRGMGRDPDVLDTWFSSALWPLSTLGWPDPAAAGPEFLGMLDAFNPSDALCTAREIITLWVSRMVMFNRYFRSGRVAEWQSGKAPDPEHSATLPLGHSATSSAGPVPF